jgi:APA family basic amino acid/polyamine antiporter
MAALPLDTWIRLIVWFLLGMGVYFIYARANAVPPAYAIKPEAAE